jgi:hypothetical protein
MKEILEKLNPIIINKIIFEKYLLCFCKDSNIIINYKLNDIVNIINKFIEHNIVDLTKK